MSFRPPPRIPPGPLARSTAEQLTQSLHDLYRFLGGFTVAAPLQMTQDTTGLSLRLEPQFQLTVQDDSGTPSIPEVTLLEFKHSDFIVTSTGPHEAHIASTGGGGTPAPLTVELDDGTSAVTDVSTLQFHTPTYLITNPAANTADVYLNWGTNIQAVGIANAAGTSERPARVDHVHQQNLTVEEDDLSPSYSVIIDIQVHAPSFVLTQPAANTARITPNWGTAIQQIGVANAAGTSELFTRVDHVHQQRLTVQLDDLSSSFSVIVDERFRKPTFLIDQPVANSSRILLNWAPVTQIQSVGLAKSAGTSEQTARADHVHDLSAAVLALISGSKPNDINSFRQCYAIVDNNLDNLLEQWYPSDLGRGDFLFGSSIKALEAGLFWALPFITPQGGTIDRLGTWATGTAADCNVRFAIYKFMDVWHIYPVTLVYDSGNVFVNAGHTGIVAAEDPVTFEPGALYWLCMMTDTGGSPTVWSVAAGKLFPILGTDFKNSPGQQYSIIAPAMAYGAYPATFPAWTFARLLNYNDESPALFVRFICPDYEVSVPCCVNTVPATLHVTLVNVSGCACMDGLTFPIVWNISSDQWENSSIPEGCAEPIMGATLKCTGSPLTWRFSIICGNTDSSTDWTVDCGPPFSLSGILTIATMGSCCAHGSQIGVIITA